DFAVIDATGFTWLYKRRLKSKVRKISRHSKAANEPIPQNWHTGERSHCRCGMKETGQLH
ncbi:hypothetical protein, partial [Salmonella enterica]|uniref:hypothetical protein n=1 Tax=Salmonella enterica TaxID=28901 RepID=UPI001C997464